MISEPILCKPLVGRVTELEHLLARRRAAAAGKGGMALIAGEPGIGKSRLVRELRERSGGGGGVRIAAAACREFAQRPFGPALEVLAQLEPAAASAVAASAGASQSEYTAALVDAFAELGARRTTLILFEDLHWADVDLLRLLTLLVEQAGRRRLLFVGTYRDQEIVPEHPLYAAFGRLLRDPALSLVRLGPLPASAMSELLRKALAGRAILPSGVVNEVRRRSDGNALFAEELLRHAVDSFTAGEELALATLPHSLQAVVRERVGRCAPWEREVLSRASVFGRRFRVELLSAIFEEAPERYVAALKRLCDLQLIDALEGDGSEFAFRHALTRDVVYGELLPAEAQPLHRRIAEAIEARPDAARYSESLAHHFWEAGELTRSAPYCAAAGAAATRVNAHEDAAIWYERTARAFGEASREGARALLDAGRSLVYADAVDRAFPLYERAAAFFLQSGEIDEFVRSRVLLTGPLYDSARPDEAIALLEETCALADGRATRAVRDRLFVRLGLLYAHKPRIEEGLRCVAAIDAAGLDPESVLTAEYYCLKARLHAARAERAEWRAASEIGVATYARLQPLSDDCRVASSNAASQALAVGELELARSLQSRSLAIAEQLKTGAGYERAMLAEIEVQAGNLSLAGELLALVPPQGRFNARVAFASAQAMLFALTGDDGLASAIDLSLIDEAARGGHVGSLVQLAGPFSFGLERLGRTREATALLTRACEAIDRAYDLRMPLGVMAVLRPALAGRLRPLLAEAAEAPQDGVNRALLAFVDAAAAHARHDEPAARHDGHLAAERFAALGWPWLQARALELTGDLPSARALQRRIGALGESRRIEHAGRAGPRPAKRSGLLTERERELAQLIAAGKGNRAAAEALSISEKAVEKYLTSIYAKLGLSSRAQLAAYIASGRAAAAST
jgi:DNA-binding CsgD family transcriptional regulator